MPTPGIEGAPPGAGNPPIAPAGLIWFGGGKGKFGIPFGIPPGIPFGPPIGMNGGIPLTGDPALGKPPGGGNGKGRFPGGGMPPGKGIGGIPRPAPFAVMSC